ncbi:MAG: helix-turn-helix domain-containing protein [Deltaproteobacteria bacterium]|nr:helix-turn-helix domain-containing protein [Deltaproteobacteria bacterium]MBW2050640.1 helix-turn-helix domain-containing protein [Deltaproteobacteria bacterium]MBW2139466.1 helix-turn-helix domain-containing protein [Deltaproteobacteria bacterium]
MEVTSETLGQRLRRQREEKGITLEEVSKATKIPVSNLEALEIGDEDKLPAPVYVRGFLKAYARELELDEWELLEEYNNTYGLTPEKFKIRVSTVPKQKSYILQISIIGLIAAVVLVAGGYYFFNRQKEPAPQIPTAQISEAKQVESKTQPEPATVTEEKKPAEDSGAAEIKKQESEPSPQGTEASPAPLEKTASMADTVVSPEPREKITITEEKAEEEILSQPSETITDGVEHVLRMDVLEETWIRIFIDGQKTRQYLLKPGESMSWQAKKYFTLKIGNAGGIKLYLDNELLPPIGEPGQVKEITLPRSEDNT